MLWCPSLPYNYNLTLSFSLSSTVIVGSRLWPYAAGCVRNYAVATEQKDEGSIAVRSKQAQQFDWALSKLDSSVRRTGRITRTLLLRIFHDVSRAGYPSGNQALLLLRSCGSLLPEVPLEERTELAHRVWEKLQELGAQYDASHYNALLKVYLQNEFKFSPTDFLAKMEAANVQPNRVTYQRLIAAYCQTGDIEGASTILGFMKNKDLPITEAVFSSLVTGHARAGDIESAKNILPVMRGAGIEPTPDTYVALLIAYAEKGDMDNLKTTLEAAESADCSLMDRDIMQVIFALAKAGHQQHIPEMIERLRHERGFVPDAMNLCLSLITQGQEDTAFLILMAFPTLQSDNFNDPNLGNFFLRHCIMNCEYDIKALTNWQMFQMPLMKLFKEQELPVRPHYFWPLLVQHGKEDNAAGVVEVMKSMQELGVSPDVETFSNYVLPVFPSREAAQQTGSGMVGLSCHFMWLFKLFFLVPAVICVVKSICVKFLFLFFQITELLYKDERFSKEGIKPAAFFLYNLMDNMTEGQVQAQEDKLRSFFNQLHTQNITISMNLFRGIKNILVSYHIPELIKVQSLIFSLMLLDIVQIYPVLALENRLAELKAENKPLNIVLKQIIQTLSAEENLQRALELKQQHEQDMTVGAYATLINLCCRHNNVDEALNLKRELSRMDSSIALDTSKYITLVKALALNDRAVDILKEMKEKNVVMNDNSITTIFHMLNAVAAKGGAGSIRRLQDTIFTLGLAKPTANLCSPVVTAYLDSNDVPGALEAALECQKRYNHLPRIHDIIVALVERGDTDLLQKAMDFVSQERGEMIMLYDLFFAFLQTGRYREARKIIETPGLRAKPGRLQWYSEKCIVNNQMEALEQMVEMTSKLFECDRDDMYSYVLRLCSKNFLSLGAELTIRPHRSHGFHSKLQTCSQSTLLCFCLFAEDTNNWQKAEAMWTKMQEENVIPRERTLHLLADILKSNGQEVPFEVPEVKPHKKMFSLPVSAESRVPGFKLTDVANSMFIITYSKKDQVKDALEKLKSMLQLDHVPSHLAITRLVQALGNHGDVAGIQQVESQIQSLGTRLNLSSMVFVNNTALAHIKNGDVESAVELLEGIYTSPDSTSPSMSFVFRKVLEGGNDRALDKLSAMAERLANHFACYRPASDLFLQLLDMDKVEDAKFMLARCNAVAEQKEVLLSFVAQKAQVPGQVTSLILDKDLTSAKALYEQMQKEGIVVDELSLKRLAVLYRNAGETAPFPEPPVSLTNTQTQRR
uniref:PROP1-like PPR domain-containing protein n=1 Tax=Amphiprion ocellaris TaxID=80972 RepID=A0AAQ5ZJH2_AMPOC